MLEPFSRSAQGSIGFVHETIAWGPLVSASVPASLSLPPPVSHKGGGLTPCSSNTKIARGHSETQRLQPTTTTPIPDVICRSRGQLAAEVCLTRGGGSLGLGVGMG